MDQGLQKTIRMQMERVGAALERNRMAVHYADTAGEVCDIVRTLLQPGETIASGGSQSLKECGVEALMKSGAYHYLDRTACKPEEVQDIYRAAFSADSYFCSANAITEQGELYNVDGNSNRIAAICYGPKQVIVVAGCNKLVTDLHAAEQRVKSLAAPANCVRLSCDSFCKETGICMSIQQSTPGMASGCHGDGRICCNYLISAQQRIQNRIHVILVGEPLGY